MNINQQTPIIQTYHQDELHPYEPHAHVRWYTFGKRIHNH